MGDWFTITIDGDIIDHPWTDRPTLEQMQEQVGGYIQTCPKHTEWHKGATPYTSKLYEAFANEEGIWEDISNPERSNANKGISGGFSVQVPMNKETGSLFAVDYSYRPTDHFQGTHAIGIRITM